MLFFTVIKLFHTLAVYLFIHLDGWCVGSSHEKIHKVGLITVINNQREIIRKRAKMSSNFKSFLPLRNYLKTGLSEITNGPLSINIPPFIQS